MSETMSIVPISTPQLPTMTEIDIMARMCKIVARSGMLSSTSRQPAEREADAFFIMGLGREIGIPTITSLRLIYSIDGKPCVSGQGMLGLILRGQFIVHMPDPGKVTDSATVRIARPGGETHEYTYTMEMAQLAGLLGKKNWRNHPKEMLCWRALGIGSKMEAADIINGLNMLEEIAPDIEVDEHGAPVQAITPEIQVERVPGNEPGQGSSPTTEPEAVEGDFSEMPAPAPTGEEPPATPPKGTWGNMTNVNKLLAQLEKDLKIKRAEIIGLIPELTVLNDPALWNKLFAEGKEAYAAIREAVMQKRAGTADASAPNQPVTDKAPVVAPPVNPGRFDWKQKDCDEMDDLCAGWLDPETSYPMLGDVMVLKLNQPGWSAYKTKQEAMHSILAFAKAAQLPMVAHKAKYMGQYTEFSNGQMEGRLYGAREALKAMDASWAPYVEKWVEGQQLNLIDDNRELVLDLQQENGYVKATNPRALASVTF